MSKSLQEQLADAEATIAAVRKQLEEQSNQLVPFDWSTKSGYKYGVSSAGHITRAGGAHLFRFSNKAEAKTFGHKLKILSCINNLKKTLGCNWEFKTYSHNHYMSYHRERRAWIHCASAMRDNGCIYFGDKGDAQRVTEYLNEHYPAGWALPCTQGEA